MSMLINWFRGYGLKKSSLGFAVLRSIIYDSNFVTEPMGKFFSQLSTGRTYLHTFLFYTPVTGVTTSLFVHNFQQSILSFLDSPR